MVQRSLSLMARLRGTTDGSSKMMYNVAAIRLPRLSPMQRAANLPESLRKDPTAATTTINDDSDVTTGVCFSGCVSHRRRENITYTATLTNPADGAVTVTLGVGATITIADGADFRNHDGSSK
ncbi:hypothetical protein OK016_00250 [Vibrio chagasii]|nr:hypothetical protein [Vibrio chagasii]